MSTALQDESSPPPVRFKKRKTAHTKRSVVLDYGSTSSAPPPPTSALQDGHVNTPAAIDDDESTSSLKEILRNRRRPRDRPIEAVRSLEGSSTDLMVREPEQHDRYTDRFVAPTGQIMDQDDTQMYNYVEARMAEQNYRKYSWPIPAHLKASVFAIAPDLEASLNKIAAVAGSLVETGDPKDVHRSNHLAAGQGKLQEVDLGSAALTSRDEKLGNGEPKGKYGYAWRKPKRRNSEDMRRDQMVEEVLSEAKIDYFDDSVPSNPFAGRCANNDDAVAERFQQEYLESLEEARQQRKPVSTTVTKGVKEAPKGPKLGGSKSARARILKAQEDEKKTVRR